MELEMVESKKADGGCHARTDIDIDLNINDESMMVRPQQTTDETEFEEASPSPELLAPKFDDNDDELLPKSWAEILQDAQPQPLPQTRLARTQASRRRPHDGIPGAHAIQGFVPWGGSRPVTTGNTNHPRHLDHDGTSIAVVVDTTTTSTFSQEQQRHELAVGQEEDESEGTDNQHLLPSPQNQLSSVHVVSNMTSKHYWRRKLLCALSMEVNVAFLTVIVVLLVLLVASKGGNSNPQNQSWANAFPLATTEAVMPQPQAPTTLLDALNLPKYTLESLEKPRSPQAKAYGWLVKNIPNHSSHNRTNLPVQVLPAWRLRQRFALATFYYATRGDHWVKNHGWLDWNTNECLWEQFLCT